MLQQIISHTPLYVWAILAFLISRGMIASADREIAVGKLFIIPVVMFGLSLSGIYNTYGGSGGALATWCVSALLVAAATWQLIAPNRIAAHPARGVIVQRGSWLPMILMLSIFCTKYAVAVALAISPALAHDTLFMVIVCALYGAFNGIFIGRLARSISVYRQAAALTDNAGARALV